MNTDSFVLLDDKHQKLCKMMFKVLNCNLLWVMALEGGLLKGLFTDHPIWQHYWDKKYYLQDPNINIRENDTNSSVWKITLGTDCDAFKKNGFFYDLYKMFYVTEFVSIEKNIGTARYCFRFFTKNDRFIFMNKLLNNMPIIKCFINAMIDKLTAHLDVQPGLNVEGLQ